MTVDSSVGYAGEVPMSTVMTRPTTPARHDHRAERRRLARCDALSSRLAELHAMRELLAQAAQLVEQGWVQDAWFTVGTPRGEVAVAAYDLRLVDTYPVTGACLAGAIVHAGGGPASVGSQLTQRTLDLTWQALLDDDEPQAALCPSPQVRTMRLLDLTRWNDTRGRTQVEVVGLLGSARRLAAEHSAPYRAEHDDLAATALVG
jgi:hypothetical protein